MRSAVIHLIEVHGDRYLAAVAYLHQNYARPISRSELAQEVGVNED